MLCSQTIGSAGLVAAGPGEARMLVITRREGEEVVIGDPENPIGVVRIASIKGDRVRVAFEFPREVSVHRREVANQIIADAVAGAEPTAPEVVVLASTRPGDEPVEHAQTNGSVRPVRTTAGRHADASRTH